MFKLWGKKNKKHSAPERKAFYSEDMYTCRKTHRTILYLFIYFFFSPSERFNVKYFSMLFFSPEISVYFDFSCKNTHEKFFKELIKKEKLQSNGMNKKSIARFFVMDFFFWYVLFKVRDNTLVEKNIKHIHFLFIYFLWIFFEILFCSFIRMSRIKSLAPRVVTPCV